MTIKNWNESFITLFPKAKRLDKKAMAELRNSCRPIVKEKLSGAQIDEETFDACFNRGFSKTMKSCKDSVTSQEYLNILTEWIEDELKSKGGTSSEPRKNDPAEAIPPALPKAKKDGLMKIIIAVCVCIVAAVVLGRVFHPGKKENGTGGMHYDVDLNKQTIYEDGEITVKALGFTDENDLLTLSVENKSNYPILTQDYAFHSTVNGWQSVAVTIDVEPIGINSSGLVRLTFKDAEAYLGITRISDIGLSLKIEKKFSPEVIYTKPVSLHIHDDGEQNRSFEGETVFEDKGIRIAALEDFSYSEDSFGKSIFIDNQSDQDYEMYAERYGNGSELRKQASETIIPHAKHLLHCIVFEKDTYSSEDETMIVPFNEITDYGLKFVFCDPMTDEPVFSTDIISFQRKRTEPAND